MTVYYILEPHAELKLIDIYASNIVFTQGSR